MRSRKYIYVSIMALAGSVWAQGAEPSEVKVAASPMPEPPRWTIGGEIRVRPEFRENNISSANPNLNHFVGSRTRLNVTLKPIDQLEAFIQPQLSRAWGEPLSTLAGDGSIGATQTSSGSVLDPTLAMHQAYVVWKPTEDLGLQIGRQELSYGDHIVLGNLNYSNVARSFDAARIRIGKKALGVDVIYAELANDEVKASGLGGSETLFGTYGYSQDFLGLSEADAYALWLYDDRSGGAADFNMGTFGLRLKKKLDIGFEGRLESNVQVGERKGQDLLAYMVDAELGWNFSVLGNLNLSVGYNHASGDDATSNTYTGYHQLFPTAHRWLGYMDLLGRRNIQSGIFRAAWSDGKAWKATLDVHSFWRVRSADSIYNFLIDTPLPGQAAPLSASKHVGEEIDMVVAYQVNKHIGFEALGGLFFAGDYTSATGTGYFSYLQGTFSF